MPLNDTPYFLKRFIEFEFQIITTEEDIKAQNSVEGLVDFVLEKVKKNQSGYTHGFLFQSRILKEFQELLGDSISLDQQPETTLPSDNRQQRWRELEDKIGYQFPVLQYPPAIAKLFTAITLLCVPGTLIGSTILVGMNIMPGWIFLSALAGLIITLLVYSYSGNLRTYIKNPTFKSLIRSIYLINRKKIDEQDQLKDENNIKTLIRNIITNEFPEEQLDKEVFNA